MSTYKLILAFCILVFTGNICFAYQSQVLGVEFPPTYVIKGAVWHYDRQVMCDATQKEDSYYDKVFNVAYSPNGKIMTFKQPYLGEFSCKSTLRHNPHFHVHSSGYAWCNGSLSECAVFQ